MTTKPSREYHVYVIELDDDAGPRADPGKPNVYVGQSVRAPAERFAQHVDGYKASRVVKKYGKHLRPRLYQRFNPLPTRDAALAMEKQLANSLRKKGFAVHGGH
jgi:hypothetical protein